MKNFIQFINEDVKKTFIVKNSPNEPVTLVASHNSKDSITIDGEKFNNFEDYLLNNQNFKKTEINNEIVYSHKYDENYQIIEVNDKNETKYAEVIEGDRRRPIKFLKLLISILKHDCYFQA